MHPINLNRAVLTPAWQQRKALLSFAILAHLLTTAWYDMLKITSFSNSVELEYSTPPTSRRPLGVTALVCKYLFTCGC